MARVLKRPAAERDLDEIAAYLQEKSGPARAIRFLAAAQATCERLGEFPRLGPLLDLDAPGLQDVRWFRIRGFVNYLILYRPVHGGIEVLRVIYGSRDLERLLRG